jgi:hypothetical protein
MKSLSVISKQGVNACNLTDGYKWIPSRIQTNFFFQAACLMENTTYYIMRMSLNGILFLLCISGLPVQSRKEDFTLNFLPNTIDISKVQTLLYHFLDGQVLQLEIKNIDQLAALEFEVGRFCDTTEINGILHFYPRGNS